MLSYLKQTDGKTSWPTSSSGPRWIEKKDDCQEERESRACFWVASLLLFPPPTFCLLYFHAPCTHTKRSLPAFLSQLFTSHKWGTRYFWLHISKHRSGCNQPEITPLPYIVFLKDFILFEKIFHIKDVLVKEKQRPRYSSNPPGLHPVPLCVVWMELLGLMINELF